jgi:hypothetical protein
LRVAWTIPKGSGPLFYLLRGSLVLPADLPPLARLPSERAPPKPLKPGGRVVHYHGADQVGDQVFKLSSEPRSPSPGGPLRTLMNSGFPYGAYLPSSPTLRRTRSDLPTEITRLSIFGMALGFRGRSSDIRFTHSDMLYTRLSCLGKHEYAPILRSCRRI